MTVLLVEDEDGARKMIEIILTRAGYTVLAAASPQAGIETADAAERLDILITDVLLPGMNGHRMAEIVRARHAKIKTLFISGYAEPGIVGPGSPDASTAFLQKPFSPTGLTVKVRELLDGKELA